MTARGLLGYLALCATLFVACTEGPTGPDVGTLNINISGLPAGAAAAVTVVGPDGFVESVASAASFDATPSGQYIVTAATTTFTEDIFAAAVAVDTVQVFRGREANLTVAYVIASGSIAFSAAGLPEDAGGEAVLQGPSGAARTVSVPSLVRGLTPGQWRVNFPRRYAATGHGYDAPSPDTLLVTASAVPLARAVTYALGTGAIAATFTGLPNGVAPRGIVFGTFGIVTTFDANGTRAGFDPGEYTVAPQNVFDADIRYSASSVTQPVSVGLVPRAYTINYLPRSGRLTLTASGIPSPVVITARVTGPAGLDTTIAVGDTLRSLPTGVYSVEGARVPIGGELYSADVLASVTILGAQTTVATLQYLSGGSFDVVVAAAYAVQAVQRRNGSVPLVANRNALIRVLGTATGPNTLSVPARVRIVNGGATVFQQDVAATSAGIPYDVDESTFQGSWRVEVPGSAIQPGAQLQVTIDPSQSVGESNRSNNTLTQALDVRALGTFRARFVPVRFAAGGNAGNVNASNSAAFFQLTRDLMPVASVDVDLRSEYVTNQPRLANSDGDIWEDVLSELNALRVLEASTRYYMGIVPVGYTSGIAGIGYLGLRTSLTWDYLPSGSEVLAHELGHNFNRYHAPCGGPASLDPLYPHTNANIGAFGWDGRLNRLRAPNAKDIMSYCDDPWVSDYTWASVIAFRENTEPAAAVIAASQPVLLVRGRITPEGVQLEPSFTLEAVPVLPQTGPHRLELRDASGAVIYAAAFRGAAVSHAKREGTEHFTFAIPIATLGGRNATALSVHSGAQSTEIRSTSNPPSLRTAPSVGAIRERDGGLRISDSDPSTRGMIIRDAATGRIISIVRGRDITLPAGLDELDILTSDGLRSSSLRIRPPSR